MYYYTRLSVSCESDFAEILMAEVAEAGFDTFLETDSGFEAYVELEKFNEEVLSSIRERYSGITSVAYAIDRVQKQNWNEQWEKSYHPIVVEDKCLIRAFFHDPDPAIPLEVVITPKMSFGTGHHQTTYLMVKNQMEMDFAGKRVLDCGCGTAILSIVASKLGAIEVEAFDIDEWSITNGQENTQVNNCSNIRIQQGTINDIVLEGHFDIILANINKNVLLSEISLYQQRLQPGGVMLLSGFFESDISDLIEEARRWDLIDIGRDIKDNWSSLLLRKA
jgi:ribosomal protein L11 methyltransferase